MEEKKNGEGAHGVDWARRSVDLLEKWFGDAFGGLGEIASDRIALWKLSNRLDVAEKAQERIAKAGIEGKVRTISSRIGAPLLEALETESDETLQDVWARLIKNAVDPDRPSGTVDRVLIDVVRKLDPDDLVVLNRLFAEDIETPRNNDIYLHWMTSPFAELPMDRLVASLDRLTYLGLLSATTSGSVGYAANKDYEAPAQLKIGTPAGYYSTQHLLVALKHAVA